MNASSLLSNPGPKAPAVTVAPTPEQLARRKVVVVAAAKRGVLAKVADLKSKFEADIASIRALIYQNKDASSDEVLAAFTPEQREALVALGQWADQGIKAFKAGE